MVILAIETSCDETAIAIIEARKEKSGTDFKILSNQIASQIKIHAPFGGVVPNLAKREHIKNLPILLYRALKEAKLIPISKQESKNSNQNQKLSTKNYKLIDAIAVTYGPGLEPALWTGINFARELAKKWRVPLAPVNHLEGHIYSAFMRGAQFSIPPPSPRLRRASNFQMFPLLTLIVSGGHTEMVLSKKHLNYKILGETLDDAAGEAFDKVARMLELGYPGGPLVSKLALKGNPNAINFPRPMIHSKDLNFSFSGLKTSVLYYIRELPQTKFWAMKTDIAASFEKAVVDVLVKKTLDAVKIYKPRTVAIGGGVGANNLLRSELVKKTGALLPEKKFTGDNAAMIAVAGYYRFLAKKFNKNPKAEGNLKLSKT
ncbi:tRNA (adenosine(37)-N6)-threonylcarbamoyltransferase complex transferase subunit TsaD [Candidatus Giovannonibacteria bacterium]|nr:tRNA (adenosine(37)-N6)-threonylcarbamoyltransferase complex transferase subunit TsaD [Candidatus Giovannonibacteria bacterium]